MKVRFRRSSQNDIDNVYNLHVKCFSKSDQWYRPVIKHYLDKGIVIETDKKNIVGVLLQGYITPCNTAITAKTVDDEELDKNNYKEDMFEPITDNGKLFFDNNIHFKELFGIVMICVDPDFRGKGLAKKLIEKHWKDNPNKILCLNTRKSNVNAFMLYKKMGYEHIAYIKNKYFLPTEDSIFMIKDLIDVSEN